MADVFVLVDDGVALATLDGDRNDLVLELAGLLRSLGLVLALHREFVLCLAGDLELLGDILRRGAHVVTVEGIPQAIADHGVDEAEVAHLLAGPQIRSEEHTSELQSLMRISYAVFCLKKKIVHTKC